MKRVYLHIDKLVLNGVAPDNASVIVAALKSQLHQSLADPENLARVVTRGNQSRLRLNHVNSGVSAAKPSPQTPAMSGQQLAKTIIKGITASSSKGGMK